MSRDVASKRRGATWIGVQNRNFSEIFYAEIVYVYAKFFKIQKEVSDRHVMSDSESESEMHQLLDDWDGWVAN